MTRIIIIIIINSNKKLHQIGLMFHTYIDCSCVIRHQNVCLNSRKTYSTQCELFNCLWEEDL